MFEYFDPSYGKINVLSNEEFTVKFAKHCNCNADSETIIDENGLHIERILCYDHQIDLFLEVKNK